MVGGKGGKRLIVSSLSTTGISIVCFGYHRTHAARGSSLFPVRQAAASPAHAKSDRQIAQVRSVIGEHPLIASFSEELATALSDSEF
jgi:hypothetical protein